MTLQELRYLVAVADEGSFSRAAEICHVGQSTLSIQIRKLEESLGVSLLDRSHRHALPTPTGEEIIAQARVTLQHAEKIRQLACNGRDPLASPLRLGVLPTLGPYLLPHFLPKLHETYPKLRLLLREDLTANLLEQLHQGELDAALLAQPIPRRGLKWEELFEEPFEVALPANHPLTEYTEIKQQDLASHCVLLLEEGHCLHDHALAICGQERKEIREEFEATSLETLRQMVARGIGCTLLPALAAEAPTGSIPPKSIQMRPFAYPVPSRMIAMTWRHGFPREEALRTLSELIRKQLPPHIMTVN